jgi:uncharacterized protein YabE (DUF348 family)
MVQKEQSPPGLRQQSLWAAVAAGLSVFLVWLYWLTANWVVVTVDGHREVVHTHRTTVDALLLDLGVTPHPDDRITPSLESELTRSLAVTVERARPIRLIADGKDRILFSWGDTPQQVLEDAGILVDTYDEILVDGKSWGRVDRLPTAVEEKLPATYDRGFGWNRVHIEPLQMRIRRSVPLVVYEGAARYTIYTTAQTVGEALRRSNVTLYLGDRVLPSLGNAVTANLSVYIQRSVPVLMQFDGRAVKTRTQGDTVADALSDLGIVLTGLDRVEPSLEARLYNNLKIVVTRVSEDVVVEEEIAPYETVYVADPALPLDSQQLLSNGAEGITRSRYRVRYENGEPISRVLEDTWLAQEPADRRIAYGQKIEALTERMSDGSLITYWRKIRMLATSYSPASAGGNRTRTGDVVRAGVVAVDPRLIPLRSQVYVPGYGIGDALDTGGGILSRRIDLAYSDESFVSVRRWVDVYLLWPPPSDSSITWVVPNYPPLPQ